MKVDKNVENTNSDSLLSKLSVVDRGYRKDPFLKELCSDPTIKSRRSPAINRGYLARLLALEVSFERFLLQGNFKQVLSLGAGFDSMFFRLKNTRVISEDLKYFEVDYPASVHRKGQRIGKSALLSSFFKRKRTIDQDVIIYDDGQLTLIGCNMVQVQELERKLISAKFDLKAPTLILTECSTTYVEAEDCDRLLGFLTKSLRHFAFISYEQIRPNDDFGKIMVNHFEKRNSSLKCVAHYPTIEKHRQRFLKHGWDDVFIRTIEEIWKRFVNDVEIQRLNATEPFDEVPELMLKCLHYVLIIGVKNHNVLLPDFWTKKSLPDPQLQVVEIQQEQYSHCFQRYGHIFKTKGSLQFMAGGISSSQKRITDITCFDSKSRTKLWAVPLETDAMFSSCVFLKDHLYIFGGRSSPKCPNNNFLKVYLDGKAELITGGNEVPCPRWSHTLTNFHDENLLLIGGRNETETFKDIYKFSKGHWTKLGLKLEFGLFDHSVSNWGNNLVVNGGLKDFAQCQTNDQILLFNPNEIKVEKLALANLFPRFAHTSHVKDDRLLQVGGVVIAPSDIILSIIDLQTNIVTNYEANQSLNAPLVHHTSILDEEGNVTIYGGGTNCFSFGMHVNSNVIKMMLYS